MQVSDFQHVIMFMTPKFPGGLMINLIDVSIAGASEHREHQRHASSQQAVQKGLGLTEDQQLCFQRMEMLKINPKAMSKAGMR